MVKHFSLRTLVVLVFFASVFASVPAANAQVSEITLDNGLRIIVSESHSVPIVAVDAWIKAGTRRESPDHPGVAHFLEHLLFQGTPMHPDEESVDGAIEDLGGTLDAATSYDWAHFYTEVPASGYPAAIALLADVLQHASLKTAAVEEERPIILDEIQRNSDDPLTNLEDSARGLVYDPASAYSRAVTGTTDQVRAVTRDQIADFYNTYYVPNNVSIVVSGDITAAEVQKVVTEQFGGWKRSSTLPADTDSERSNYAASTDGSSKIHRSLVEKDADQSYLVMAFAAPSVSDTPDPWDMDVLLTLLGQGGNNRLNTQLKQKLHLVTSIQADYLTQKDPGILTVSAALPTANVQTVQSSILDQIQQLRDDPVSDSELESAKNALKASYLFDVDTDSGHADSLGFYDSIDSFHYDVDYLTHVSSVTSADIQRIAQKYLDPDAYTVVLQVPSPDATIASTTSSATKFVSDSGMVESK